MYLSNREVGINQLEADLDAVLHWQQCSTENASFQTKMDSKVE